MTILDKVASEVLPCRQEIIHNHCPNEFCKEANRLCDGHEGHVSYDACDECWNQEIAEVE